jgi:hypothetical protein
MLSPVNWLRHLGLTITSFSYSCKDTQKCPPYSGLCYGDSQIIDLLFFWKARHRDLWRAVMRMSFPVVYDVCCSFPITQAAAFSSWWPLLNPRLEPVYFSFLCQFSFHLIFHFPYLTLTMDHLQPWCQGTKSPLSLRIWRIHKLCQFMWVSCPMVCVISFHNIILYDVGCLSTRISFSAVCDTSS